MRFDDLSISFGWNHPQGLQLALTGIRQVPDLYFLKKRQLDGIAANRQADYLIFFYSQVGDHLIGGPNYDIVRMILTDFKGKMQVIDDIGTGEGMPSCYGGG